MFLSSRSGFHSLAETLCLSFLRFIHSSPRSALPFIHSNVSFCPLLNNVSMFSTMFHILPTLVSTHGNFIHSSSALVTCRFSVTTVEYVRYNMSESTSRLYNGKIFFPSKEGIGVSNNFLDQCNLSHTEYTLHIQFFYNCQNQLH